MDAQRKHELARLLVSFLLDEAREHGVQPPANVGTLLASPQPSFDELWLAFRSLVNVRPPWPAAPEFLAAQDELLNGLIEEAGVVTLTEMERTPLDARLHLWRGDITRMAVDAVVNAANTYLTGCWIPLHYCIDNALHTYAGVQLRAECAALMDAQGHEEPTGAAKVTAGYNLPAAHVIHTVGPIANGQPTATHRRQLAQCYRACLDAAVDAGAHSLAFCSISTGVFGFPQAQAAPLAVNTVRTWLDTHADAALDVVFDVFSAEDEHIYRKQLGW